MQQLTLQETQGWGGYREGAGRKKQKNKSMQNHVKRPVVKSSQPVHVTFRLVKGLGKLRTKKGFRVFHRAVVKAQRKGLKLIHYSIQSNHLHLIVETKDNSELSKAIQSFAISFARQLNSLRRRSGRVFSDRYHMHILKTSREIKNAIKYVLLNASKHKKLPPFLDSYSSGPAFEDWSVLGLEDRLKNKHHFKDRLLRSYIEDLIRLPQTWLLKVGWKKYGLSMKP